MNYATKQRLADKYLLGFAGIYWDDLGDINSLHDCETLEDIEEFCNERLEDAMFPFE